MNPLFLGCDPGQVGLIFIEFNFHVAHDVDQVFDLVAGMDLQNGKMPLIFNPVFFIFHVIDGSL